MRPPTFDNRNTISIGDNNCMKSFNTKDEKQVKMIRSNICYSDLITLFCIFIRTFVTAYTETFSNPANVAYN